MELTNERHRVSFAVTAHKRLHACNIAESLHVYSCRGYVQWVAYASKTLTEHAHLLFEEPLKFIAHDKSCWYQYINLVSVTIIRRYIMVNIVSLSSLHASHYAIISNYCVLQSVKP